MQPQHPYDALDASIDGLPTWPQLLAAAAKPAEVVAIANEYLARVDPRDLAALPAECRRASLASGPDIGAYAFALKAFRYGDLHAEAIAHRIAAFLTDASLRLSAIETPLPSRAENAAWIAAIARDTP